MDLREEISRQITDGFKTLLCEKHLYQNLTVEIDIRKLAEGYIKIARQGAYTQSALAQVEDNIKQFVHARWLPDNNMTLLAPKRITGPNAEAFVQFKMPSINTYCSNCNGSWPFNELGESITVGPQQRQMIYIGYECQQCKTHAVYFQIQREGMKLTLTGRAPIEVVPVPTELPKIMRKYVSDAIIAHHAGQTLAGIFLLRTSIEQFWRSLPQVHALVDKQPKATGDEQAAVYQSTLPDDFKARFPSLRDIYNILSAAMHTANGDALVFDECREKINKHFKARQIYEI